MTRLEKQVIAAVLHSLETEPNKWRYDGFRVGHERNLASVWVANGHFGLHVDVDGERIPAVERVLRQLHLRTRREEFAEQASILRERWDKLPWAERVAAGRKNEIGVAV